MQRSPVVSSLVALLTGCAIHSSEFKPSVTIAGQKCCVKHRIPLISVRGFQTKPTILVHCHTERCATCTWDAPNRIEEREHLYRTRLHRVPAIVTYCPLCEAEFIACVAEYQLPDRGTQQIRTLVSPRSHVRQPVIRIVAIDTESALVVTGAEHSVGDVFDELGVAQREGKWYISSS